MRNPLVTLIGPGTRSGAWTMGTPEKNSVEVRLAEKAAHVVHLPFVMTVRKIRAARTSTQMGIHHGGAETRSFDLRLVWDVGSWDA